MLPEIRRATPEEIPLIDLHGFQFSSAEQRQETISSLSNACKSAGFLYLTNHGVAPEMIDGIYGTAHKFFALPEDAKEEISIKKSGYAFSGYLPSGHIGSDPKMKGDLHESFQIQANLPEAGRDAGASAPLDAGNLWPSAMPELRPDVLAYRDAVTTLGRNLLQLLAAGIGLPEDAFTRMATEPTSMLRLLHYPPQMAVEEGGSLGTRAHNDTSIVTILAQDEVGGLEILLKSGEWVSAPPVRHCFIVNIGDLLQAWTDGIYVSTPHRVINRSGAERYSVPFFMNPNYRASFDPITKNPGETRETFHSLIQNPNRLCYGDWVTEVYSRIYNDPRRSAA